MARTYTIRTLEVLPKFDDHTDVAITADFIYGDENGILQTILQFDPPGDDFTPISDVTPEVALEWVLAKVATCPPGEERTYQELYDARLDEQAAAKANRPYQISMQQFDDAPAEEG